jgi:hypothetical protein
MKNAYGSLGGNSQGKILRRNIRVEGKIMFKCFVGKMNTL